MNDVNNLVDKLKGEVAYRQFDNAPSPNRQAWPVLERIAEAQGRALGAPPPAPAPSIVPPQAAPAVRYGHAQEAPTALPPNFASNFPAPPAPAAAPSAPPVPGLPFAMGSPAPVPSNVQPQPPLQPQPSQLAPGMPPMGVFASPPPQAAPLPHHVPASTAFATPGGQHAFQPAPAAAPAPAPVQAGGVPLSQILGGAPLRASPPSSPTGSLLSRYGGNPPATEPAQQPSGQFPTDPSAVALSDVFARLGRQTR